MQTDEHMSTLIERIAERWLQETGDGREILSMMTLDQAIDAVFELLNAGLLKMTRDGETVSFRPCKRPSPPQRPIVRTVKPAQ